MLNKYIQHINENFSKHPKYDITVRVLSCLQYIHENIDGLALYAARYKPITEETPNFVRGDDKKGVLRAPNGMSFHINSYLVMADQSKAHKSFRRDYSALTESIAECLEFLLSQPKSAQERLWHTFMDKIQDTQVGCMDARINEAHIYLRRLKDGNGQIINDIDTHYLQLEINELAESKTSSYQKTIQLIIKFAPYMGERCEAKGRVESEVTISPSSIIHDYNNVIGVEVFMPPEAMIAQLLTEKEPEVHFYRSLYRFNFYDEDTAIAFRSLAQDVLQKDHPDIKNAIVSGNGQRGYQFGVNQSQLNSLAKIKQNQDKSQADVSATSVDDKSCESGANSTNTERAENSLPEPWQNTLSRGCGTLIKYAKNHSHKQAEITNFVALLKNIGSAEDAIQKINEAISKPKGIARNTGFGCYTMFHFWHSHSTTETMLKVLKKELSMHSPEQSKQGFIRIK